MSGGEEGGTDAWAQLMSDSALEEGRVTAVCCLGGKAQ